MGPTPGLNHLRSSGRNVDQLSSNLGHTLSVWNNRDEFVGQHNPILSTDVLKEYEISQEFGFCGPKDVILGIIHILFFSMLGQTITKISLFVIFWLIQFHVQGQNISLEIMLLSKAFCDQEF